METQMMFMDCPAYLDNDGTLRCGLPAEVQYRYAFESTDAPLESAKIQCPRGHWFNGPVEMLTWRKDQDSADAARRISSAT
ncbi:MAG TPA: hypothetical protein VIV12_16855 [Streptosporangiaceae bacterium]